MLQSGSPATRPNSSTRCWNESRAATRQAASTNCEPPPPTSTTTTTTTTTKRNSRKSKAKQKKKAAARPRQQPCTIRKRNRIRRGRDTRSHLFHTHTHTHTHTRTHTQRDLFILCGREGGRGLVTPSRLCIWIGRSLARCDVIGGWPSLAPPPALSDFGGAVFVIASLECNAFVGWIRLGLRYV